MNRREFLLKTLFGAGAVTVLPALKTVEAILPAMRIERFVGSFFTSLANYCELLLRHFKDDIDYNCSMELSVRHFFKECPRYLRAAIAAGGDEALAETAEFANPTLAQFLRGCVQVNTAAIGAGIGGVNFPGSNVFTQEEKKAFLNFAKHLEDEEKKEKEKRAVIEPRKADESWREDTYYRELHARSLELEGRSDGPSF